MLYKMILDRGGELDMEALLHYLKQNDFRIIELQVGDQNIQGTRALPTKRGLERIYENSRVGFLKEELEKARRKRKKVDNSLFKSYEKKVLRCLLEKSPRTQKEIAKFSRFSSTADVSRTLYPLTTSGIVEVSYATGGTVIRGARPKLYCISETYRSVLPSL